ncbi:MAG: hypothetical protein R2939_17855 [Kofleriaceae bacterium]
MYARADSPLALTATPTPGPLVATGLEAARASALELAAPAWSAMPSDLQLVDVSGRTVPAPPRSRDEVATSVQTPVRAPMAVTSVSPALAAARGVVPPAVAARAGGGGAPPAHATAAALRAPGATLAFAPPAEPAPLELALEVAPRGPIDPAPTRARPAPGVATRLDEPPAPRAAEVPAGMGADAATTTAAPAWGRWLLGGALVASLAAVLWLVVRAEPERPRAASRPRAGANADTGSVDLVVVPSNARVTIDGRAYFLPNGRASIDLAGRHLVEVERPGGNAVADYVIITAGRSTSLRIDTLSIDR